MKNILVKNKELCDRQAVASFLKDLSEKMAQGQVTLKQGEDQVQIAVPERVIFRINAKEVNNKRRVRHALRLAISWVEGQDATSPVTLG